MLPVTALTVEEGKLCPIRNVLSRVFGKWQSLILLSLEDGPLRFSEVKRTLGDITQRVLTENLRSLERDGYLIRKVDPGPPIAVSYELTGQGRDLVEVLKPIVVWAFEHFEHVTAARQTYDDRISG